MADAEQPVVRYSSEEDELLLEDEVTRRSVRMPRRRGVAMVLGAIALVACGAVALMGSRRSQGEDDMLTLRNLLESPAVHDVATHNIVKVQRRLMGHSVPPADLHTVVKDQFRKISKAIDDGSPKALDTTFISRKHHDAAVHMMRYLSDARMQSVGLETAHAIRDARSGDPEVVKQHILAKLAPRAQELKHLHSVVIPAEVRELLAKHNDGFDELLQPKRVRLLKSLDDTWDSLLSPALDKEDAGVPARQLQFNGAMTTTAKPLAVALDVIGIIGALAEEVSVLLRMIKPLTKIMPGSHDLNLSPTATSAIGLVDALFNTVSCELDAVQDENNPVEMATCPLMSGSAAFDMLRAVFMKIGLLGDNDPTNGVQGNHAGTVNPAAAAAASMNPVLCVIYNNCAPTPAPTPTPTLYGR